MLIEANLLKSLLFLMLRRPPQDRWVGRLPERPLSRVSRTGHNVLLRECFLWVRYGLRREIAGKLLV